MVFKHSYLEHGGAGWGTEYVHADPGSRNLCQITANSCCLRCTIIAFSTKSFLTHQVLLLPSGLKGLSTVLIRNTVPYAETKHHLI